MCCRALAKTLVLTALLGLALASPSAAFGARIIIPKLGLDVPLARSLEHGPTVYYRDGDTLAIAGHRTTYSHPFLELPRLRAGDTISVGRTRYVVRRKAIVRPWQTWVLDYRGLVLSACHPAGSDRFRYVVFAAAVG